jgi:hypothetical protein
VLKKEGLPDSVLERLAEEGVPVDLVEYLTPDSPPASEAEQVEKEPRAGLEDKAAPPEPTPQVKDENEAIDIEPLLPRKLPLDPEWGRGPLDWESQVMVGQELPFVKLLQKLSREPITVPERSEEMIAPSTALAVSGRIEEISITTSQVGFRRRRLELVPRPRDPLPRLPAPAPTGGTFQPRERHIT